MTYFGRPVIPHWIRHRALRTLCSTQVIGRLIAALEVMQSDQEGFLGMLVRDLEAVLLCDEPLNQTSLAIRSIRWSMLTISQRCHQDSLVRNFVSQIMRCPRGSRLGPCPPSISWCLAPTDAERISVALLPRHRVGSVCISRRPPCSSEVLNSCPY